MKNYPQSLRLILATCAVAGMAKIAAAQAVAPAPTKSGSVSTSEEAAVVLNPFTVSTQRDTGFVAASSLAGGRLASDLRDTAADYSVLTRDFIDAHAVSTQKIPIHKMKTTLPVSGYRP